MKRPKLTVFLLTYNHELYIEQAIESILEQKTNFDFDIIVAEDCSTDKTLEIVLKYQKLYPEKIKVYANKKNLGATETLCMTLSKLTGDYIAFLEGDDYWCNPNKLQIQVDFLDANSEFVGCANTTFLKFENGNTQNYPVCIEKPYITFYDIARNCVNYNYAAVVYRNIYKEKWPEWFFTKFTSQWLLDLAFTLHGNVKILDEVMSVYRYTGKGIWSSLSDLGQKMCFMRLYYSLDKLFKSKYQKHFFNKRVPLEKKDFKEIIINRDISSLIVVLNYFRKYSKVKMLEIIRYCYISMLEILEVQ